MAAGKSVILRFEKEEGLDAEDGRTGRRESMRNGSREEYVR
jgi:hypothetical protein